MPQGSGKGGSADDEVGVHSAVPVGASSTDSPALAVAALSRTPSNGTGAASSSSSSSHGVGFWTALMIPGVINFSMCLFFSKLVAYTFLYWLPFYISKSEIGGQPVSAASAGQLSTLFDVGGVLGGVAAGFLSDRLSAHASVSFSFLMLSIPVLYLFNAYGHLSMTINVVLLLLGGALVNGPYALITTAVSADLGQHKSLKVGGGGGGG